METPMYVIKRDGTVKDFDISKIAAALEKAGKATGEFDAATANRITHIEVMNSRMLRLLLLNRFRMP